eukprot:1161988-Pelagomonas_calceolata.AAC.3
MITPEQAKAPFRLIRLIGRGGFGNVYLGEWDGEKVAVKVCVKRGVVETDTCTTNLPFLPYLKGCKAHIHARDIGTHEMVYGTHISCRNAKDKRFNG